MDPNDLRDIQGLILSGYGKKPAARYAIFQIVDGEAARRWLRHVLNDIQYGSYRGTRRREPPFLDDLCFNVAFSQQPRLADYLRDQLSAAHSARVAVERARLPMR